MKILCESGVIISRKDGKWTYYSFDDKVVEYAKELLHNYTKKLISE